MSDSELIADIMQLVKVDYVTAKEILDDSRLFAITDTALDKHRRTEFVNRLPTYQQAMRFA